MNEGPWSSATPPEPPRRRAGFALWLVALLIAGLFVLALTQLFPGQLSGDDGFRILYLFGALAVVTRGLVGLRGVRLGAAARGAAAWIAIVTVVLLAYVYRDELSGAATRVRTALNPSAATELGARSMVIGRSEEGGFYVTGEVNGAPVRFLIDTGASDIVLSPADAQRAGLRPAPLAYTQPNETANGVGYGASAVADSLTVGSVRLSQVAVSINAKPMSASLLGMPFLKRLASFEVRGDELILHAR